MTKEELIRYGKDYLHDLETACCLISDIHKEFVREAIKALEIVEEFEKAQIITGGRLNGRTYAYKCGLEDGKRKALEQQPSDDCVSRANVKELFQEGCVMGMYDFLGIDDLPPVTPTFPKCETNGEMLKAVFPNADPQKMLGSRAEVYMWDWWGRPYEEKRGNDNESIN